VLVEIKVWMARRNITQVELAAELGVAQSWVSKRLNGVVGLTVEDMFRLAEALDVPPWEFLRPAPQTSRNATELMQYRYTSALMGKVRAASARTLKPAA
jgi:transcriptional regulator with XRE-family HTH domain